MLSLECSYLISVEVVRRAIIWARRSSFWRLIRGRTPWTRMTWMGHWPEKVKSWRTGMTLLGLPMHWAEWEGLWWSERGPEQTVSWTSRCLSCLISMDVKLCREGARTHCFHLWSRRKGHPLWPSLNLPCPHHSSHRKQPLSMSSIIVRQLPRTENLKSQSKQPRRKSKT